ncbi:MAG: sulfite exporter TauE/SafE family protein [Candidatus Shapirobacteria bacterium]|jgi:sulfite exporter TauE/SafE/copper chaperone CopZ|nr:sulfite exporter TauE/SafE family protein [Candidatus Shapirobacteria bacterium]
MIKQLYKVEGMHCKSCEILIENNLEEKEGIKKAEVNLTENSLEIESDKKIKIDELNRIFKKNGYKFLELERKPFPDPSLDRAGRKLWWIPAAGVIVLFFVLNKLGLGSFLNINSQSSLLTFFILGIIAGFSTCGALLSGIIISYPRRTLEIIIGRIVGYTILGIILGMVGQTIAIIGFSNVMVIVVSIIMAIVGLQMLEVKWAQKIKINLPKSINKKIVNKKLPIIIGFLTVLLPCGFTLLTESVAMISGNWVSGMLIMLAFVLGTSIPLFLIGISNEKFIKSQKTVGLLILFFVLYTLNFQFGILKPTLTSLEKGGLESLNTNENVEVVKTSYTRFMGLNPYTLTVKKGQRVRIEIEVKESEYGCMSTILLPGLFNRAQTLVAGKTLIMEFTPNNVGTYKFACAMGVPHKGEVNVIK